MAATTNMRLLRRQLGRVKTPGFGVPRTIGGTSSRVNLTSYHQPQHHQPCTGSHQFQPVVWTASMASSASSSSSSTSAPLRKTPLYDFHVAHGAKMVPFAGHHMPVLYSSLGLADSHRFTRTQASLFDVSHMVQHRFRGPGAAAFLESICPSAISSLGVLQGRLTTFLWPKTGGIVDDTIVMRLSETEFYVVTNGACHDKDLAYLEEQKQEFQAKFGASAAKDLDFQHVSSQAGLLALQGPRSAEILQEMVVGENADLKALHFGNAIWARLKLGKDGVGSTGPLLISRGGYTGEDGFEICLGPSDNLSADTTALAEALLSVAGPERLQLAGLGARDSLRLEAGMCLYGHDLDDSTTPVEAGLSWVISPERRAGGGFHGSEVVLAQLVPKSKGGRGVERRRVGFVVEAGAPAREGAEIRGGGEAIGAITSGMPSPTLGKNIAMGYVRDGFHKAGTEVTVVVRGKERKATVTKMPFVPTKYWKGLAPA